MEADAADAIEQFEAQHVILFEGAPADGIRAAAEAVKAAGQSMYIHTARVGGLSGSMVKVPPWQCPSSPPVPSQDAPGGSALLGSARPVGSQPRPQVLELAASKVAYRILLPLALQAWPVRVHPCR